MKTKAELNALKAEVENLTKKLGELTDDELAEVTGGVILREEPLDVDRLSADTNKNVTMFAQIIKRYLTADD